MEMIYKGAEAEIWKTDFLGIESAEKRRIPKKYRIKEIDSRIRRERMKKEIIMTIEARKAVKTPFIFETDMKNSSFTMEFINGKKVRDLLYKGEKIRETGREIGKSVRKMHEKNIIHNDLTTSNMILNSEGLWFIDFGLATTSCSVEDKAVDILVFKKMVKSTHWKQFEEIWKEFAEAYADEKILGKAEEIEKRARYAEH